MKEALKLAHKAFVNNEIPIAAVVLDSKTKKIIARAYNKVEEYNNATCHAEIIAINKACKALGSKYLTGCEIYVTLEPCSMCASAIALARVGKLYFGAYDIKTGGVEHGAKIFSHKNTHHKIEVIGGVMEQECGELIKKFFAEKLR